jgi:manganese/iron transport system permease protein
MCTITQPMRPLTVLDLISDPLSYRFMRLALVEVLIMGIAAGFLGSFVVMRGLAFVGDAISHAVFPGVVIAFLADVSLFFGAAAFGILTALAISSLSLTRRLREDTAIGVVFAGAFALGVVLISTSPGYTRDLTSFLFGDVLAVTMTDIWLSVTIGGGAVLLALALRRAIVLASFDREMALSMGLPVFLIETVLLLLITLTIVISLRAVGNILVLAMFVTPAATARLLTDNVSRLMAISATLGATSGVVGLYVSWYTDLAAGGTIVLTATSFFIAALLFAPRHGFVWRALGVRPPLVEEYVEA